MKTGKSKDWSTQVLKDLTEFEIRSSFSEIGLLKEENWKSLVKSQSTVCALKYLNSIVGSKSKKYQELKISYFLSSHSENIPVETAKFIAKTQSHMIETIKTNFQVYYKPNLICNACSSSECHQSHLLNCQKLIGSNELVTYLPNYEDIFDERNPEEKTIRSQQVTVYDHVHLLAVCCCTLAMDIVET